jgi:hypothetical protein
MEKLIEKAYKNFKEEGHTDDRKLFRNIYEIREELKSEEPKTEAGKRAIRRAIIDYDGQLNSLYFGLSERNMI